MRYRLLPRLYVIIIVTIGVLFSLPCDSNSASLSNENIFASGKQIQNHNCPIGKGDEGDSLTLQSVQIVFRHGTRTPLYPYPKDPYANHDYGVGIGELIPGGKYHSFLLGRCFRQSYNDLLEDNYTPEKLFCRSAVEDRTQVTGLSCLAGLYPPVINDPYCQLDHLNNIRWQPIPCRTTQFLIDNKISSTGLCPAYLSDYLKYKASPEVVQFKDEYQWLYDNLTVLTGKTIVDFDDVQHIYDDIIIQKEEFYLPYPPWFPPLKFAMKENSDFSWNAAGDTRILLLARVTPLLNEIVNNFNSFTGQQNSDGTSVFRNSKMYLFSGHGTPMIGLAQVLGFYDRHETPPYFNAALVFELHKRDEIYYIKVFFKNGYDQPNVQKSIGGCPDPCTFDQFKTFYNEFFISQAEWLRRCQIVSD